MTRENASIIPPMLYLPVRIGSEGQQHVEVREVADGRRVLLAFTALDRLADQCGLEQPWILVHIDLLGDIRADFPFDAVSFDPRIGPGLTRDGRLL